MRLKVDTAGIRVVVDAVRNKVYQIDEIDLDGATFNILTRKVTAEVGDGADLGPLEDRVTAAETAITGLEGDVTGLNTRIDFVGDNIAALDARVDNVGVEVTNGGDAVTDADTNPVTIVGSIEHSILPGSMSHGTFHFKQSTDPALDPENNVEADHWWLDTNLEEVTPPTTAVPDLEAVFELSDATDELSEVTMTNTGSVTFGLPSKVGNAAQFGGTNMLSTIDSPTMSIGGHVDFTFMCFVRFAATPAGDSATILGKWDSVSQREYILDWITSSNRLRWGVSPDNTNGFNLFANTLGAVSIDTWYHLIAKHDAVNDQLILKVNNVAETPVSHATGVANSTAPFTIGGLIVNGGADRMMEGAVDQVFFFKKKTSDAEDTWMYNAGAGRSYAEVFAEYGEAIPATYGAHLKYRNANNTAWIEL